MSKYLFNPNIHDTADRCTATFGTAPYTARCSLLAVHAYDTDHFSIAHEGSWPVSEDEQRGLYDGNTKTEHNTWLDSLTTE